MASMHKREGMAFSSTGFYRVTMVLVATVALAILCSCNASAGGAQGSDSASASADSNTATAAEETEEEKDRVSFANLRTAYAEAASAYQMEEGPSKISMTMSSGKIATVSVSGVRIASEQANDWSGRAKDASFPVPNDEGKPIEDATVTFTFDAEGNATSTTYAPTGA